MMAYSQKLFQNLYQNFYFPFYMVMIHVYYKLKLSLNGQKMYYIIFHRARIKLTGHTSDLYMGGSILIATDNNLNTFELL